jgi:hypothetical protein
MFPAYDLEFISRLSYMLHSHGLSISTRLKVRCAILSIKFSKKFPESKLTASLHDYCRAIMFAGHAFRQLNTLMTIDGYQNNDK